MRLFVAFATIWLGAASTALCATMAEVVGAFTVNCMGQIDNHPKLQEFLAKGGVKLRPEHGDPILKPHSGTAYLSKYDNGGQMIIGVVDGGGCKIISKEAERRDVARMVTESLKQHIRTRHIATESSKDVVRDTYTVVFRDKRVFMQVFGPVNKAGVSVEVFPFNRPPSELPPSRIVWPD